MIKNKILFVSHTANFSKFNLPFMRWFREKGWAVDYASDGTEEVGDCDRHFTVGFNRSPYSRDNILARKQLAEIIGEENYNIIHCHTPMGGVVARLAAREARGNGTKVIYTAHGFHFYKGAPRANWLFYYPVEKYLSRFTDTLVTINNEDFVIAAEKFHAGRTYKIGGVGVDLTRFSPATREEKTELRERFGYTENDFILLCVAEFIPRKRHIFLINEFNKLRKAIPHLKLVLAGRGKMLESSKLLCENLGIGDRVNFLGYTTEVPEWCKAADILVSASGQEGLPINVLEGMAAGLPIVCTKIRGHIDIIEKGENGFLFNPKSSEQFCTAVRKLWRDVTLRSNMSAANIEKAREFSVENAVEEMSKIYGEYM